LRSGELTPVWVPDEEHEALRDLVRAREDAKRDLSRRRQQLGKFLLRNGVRPPEGVRPWSRRHREWLESLRLPQPAQQIVLAESLQALAEAVGIVAEVGDITRFDRPEHLMSYAGLVPSEHSSGSSRRQGAITKTGNNHLRWLLVEAAWHYRHHPRVGVNLRKRQSGLPESVKQIAWKAAQVRLNHKYRRLTGRGKSRNKAVVAVARELLGFIWAVAREVQAQQVGQTAAD
jgi:transposase